MTAPEWMARLGFPAEAAEELEAARQKIETEALSPLLAAAQEALFFDGKGDFEVPLAEISRVSGVRRETADMVFLVSCLPRLAELYRERAIPEEIFWNTMGDLRFKLSECCKTRGVWGLFATFWYPGFYRLERFGLGRLQFERYAFPRDDVPGLLKGQTVYNCHIPSSGPLTPELVDDAFRRAKEFFAEELHGAAMPVYCASWMLYPPQIALFPEGSNLRRFAERFTILDSAPDPTNGNLWRVFDRPWEKDKVSELPEDTTLRRALKAFLQSGNTMGAGYGLLWV